MGIAMIIQLLYETAIIFFIFFFCLSPSDVFIYLFIFISWRLITLQYYSGFCHTLT